MPYKFETDKKKIERKYDHRVKLTDKERKEIKIFEEINNILLKEKIESNYLFLKSLYFSIPIFFIFMYFTDSFVKENIIFFIIIVIIIYYDFVMLCKRKYDKMKFNCITNHFNI